MIDSPFGFLLDAKLQAQHAVGRTHPNPPVGCVVVKDNKVVGRGFTSPAGGPHAEVHALREAGEQAKGSTLYVTLEPCSHFGRTPPCVDAIIQAGVSHVVVGMQDPNPLVNGAGIQKLIQAGIDVEMGDADLYLKPFVKFVTQKKPWVIAKIATSLDGRLSNKVGIRTQISGAQANEQVHRLRNCVDAVMVGANTVLIDDPKLTVRGLDDVGVRNPIRVVIDGSLQTDIKSQVYQGGAIVIHAGASRVAEFQRAGIETIAVPKMNGHTSLPDAFSELANRGITSVLVECGQSMFTQLLNDDLIDEMWWITAPKIFGSEGTGSVDKMSSSPQYVWQEPVVLGDDVLRVGLRR